MSHNECAEKAQSINAASGITAQPSGRSPYGHACALRDMAEKLSASNSDRETLLDAAQCVQRIDGELAISHSMRHTAELANSAMTKRLEMVGFVINAITR